MLKERNGCGVAALYTLTLSFVLAKKRFGLYTFLS
jgi:hypothetical protein